MTKNLTGIDEAALSDAAAELGTETDVDTINAALRESAARRRRQQALDDLVRMAKEGAIDVDFLMDKKNYRR